VTTTEEQLSAVDAQRRKMHKKQGAALLGILGPFADKLSLKKLRKAITEDSDIQVIQATTELTRQAKRLGVLKKWQTMNGDAHLIARAQGTAAAAHVRTDGTISATPSGVDAPDDLSSAAGESMTTDQLKGLAFDVANLANMTDDELLGVIESSPSALYYLDLQTSIDFLTATNNLYNALGVTQVDWSTMNDERVCIECDELQARSPYSILAIPDVPHGFCRCWTMPA
jgi:hypothetical protein